VKDGVPQLPGDFLNFFNNNPFSYDQATQSAKVWTTDVNSVGVYELQLYGRARAEVIGGVDEDSSQITAVTPTMLTITTTVSFDVCSTATITLDPLANFDVGTQEIQSGTPKEVDLSAGFFIFSEPSCGLPTFEVVSPILEGTTMSGNTIELSPQTSAAIGTHTFTVHAYYPAYPLIELS